MTKLEALKKLSKSLTAGDKLSYEEFSEYHAALEGCHGIAYEAYLGDFSPALNVLKRLLPDWNWRKSHYDGTVPYKHATMWVTMPGQWRQGHTASYNDGNDARALLTAIVRALIAQEEQK